MSLRTLVKASVAFALVVAAGLVVLGVIVAAATWVALVPLRIIARRQRKLDDTQALERLLKGRT